MRIVVVEDEYLIRELLVKITEDVLGYDVVGEAASGLQALEVCRRVKPDVVLMDIIIPEMDGIEIAKILLLERSEIRILTLSSGYDQYTLYRLFQSGVHGYVDKLSSSVEILGDAIKAVASGKNYFSELSLKVKMDMQSDVGSFVKVLSDREVEMMPFFARGISNTSIAEQLNISPLTVQSHRRSVMKKLNLHSVKDLMRYAIEKGFWRNPVSKD